MAKINFPFIVVQKKNVEYFSNSVFFGGVYAVVIPGKKPVVLTNNLEKFNIKPNACIIVYEKKELKGILRKLMGKYKKVGIENDLGKPILKKFKKMIGRKNYVDISEYIAEKRRQKNSSEIKKIQRAGNVAEIVLNDVLKRVKPGMTEKEIWRMLKKRCIDYDCETRFCIVQADSNSGNLHAQPGNKKLKRVLLIDFGPEKEEYGTDITRTFLFKPNKLESEVYNIVLRAQRAGLKTVKAGVKCSDVDRAARDVIKEAGYGNDFVHATGHGVGLDIHEAPSLSEDSKQILKAGDVVTIEPGIYLPGKFGVRIEDTVLVTKKGYKLLTHFKK